MIAWVLVAQEHLPVYKTLQEASESHTY